MSEKAVPITRRKLLVETALALLPVPELSLLNRVLYGQTLAETPYFEHKKISRGVFPKEALLRLIDDCDDPAYYRIEPDSHVKNPRSPFHGKNFYVPKDFFHVLSPKDLRPEPRRNSENALRVVIKLKVPQELTVFDGPCPIFASPICAGARVGSTPVGTHQVFRSRLSRHMQGVDYDLPGVGFVQYFHYLGIALHSAYWRTPEQFGRPYSHGCVNLPYASALWLFANLVDKAPSYYGIEEKFAKGVQIEIS